MKLRRSIALLLVLVTAGVCRAELEFSGYVEAGKGIRFMVTDAGERKSSGWIVLGQAFQDHVLVGFDAKDEVLTVRKGGKTLALPLKAARVRDAQPEAATAAAELAAARIRLEELRKRYRDGHPEVQTLLKKIAALEQRQRQ
jgi:hypothetical protein